MRSIYRAGQKTEAARIKAFVDRLGQEGSQRLVGRRWAEKMNDVWQLRAGQHRIFYFWLPEGERYVILNGYRKRSRRTPRSELARAESHGPNILEDEEKIMTRHEVEDSHAKWLEDIEYRQEFGSETAKLEVAAVLTDAREAAGMTQSALAERAGVSQAYIAKLERGDANPTIGHIGRLLACMGMKPSVSVAPMEPAASSESVQREGYTSSKFEAAYSNSPLADVAGSPVEQTSPAV